MLAGLVETLGPGPAAALLTVAGLGCLALPFWTWRDRGRWTTREARVEAIASRRSLASSTWAVAVTYEADGERQGTIPVNLVRRPLSLGDRVPVLVHPRYPGRVVATRWQGAETPVMVGLLFLLGAFVIVAR